MRSILLAALLAMTLLAGCTSEAVAPQTDSEVIPVVDASSQVAAVPEEVPAISEEASEDTPPLSGFVLDADGNPIAAAQVYFEVVNLAEPVNNIVDYIAGKEATLQVTDADGAFTFYVEAGEQVLAVRADGYLPWSAPVTITSDGTQLTITLTPRSDVTQVTAHRGASAYAPENTLSAIWKAHLLGGLRHEFDVVLSQDGVPYLLHDLTLDRTTTCSGHVAQFTYAGLADCDAGSWFDESFTGEHLPTLEEALQLSLDLGMFAVIEVKYDNDPAQRTMEASWQVADAKGITPETGLLMSFHHGFAIQCSQMTDHRCGQILFSGDGVGNVQETALTAFEVDEIHAPSRSVNEGYVQAMHDLGYAVTAWTVDDPAAMDELIAWGVNGLTTNTPDVAMNRLVAAQGGQGPA